MKSQYNLFPYRYDAVSICLINLNFIWQEDPLNRSIYWRGWFVARKRRNVIWNSWEHLVSVDVTFWLQICILKEWKNTIIHFVKCQQHMGIANSVFRTHLSEYIASSFIILWILIEMDFEGGYVKEKNIFRKILKQIWYNYEYLKL